MNIQYVKLLICGFIVLSCISCNSKKSEKNVSSSLDSDSIISTETDTAIIVTLDDTLTFSVYQKKIEAHLNNDTKMPYCDFNINMVYPSGFSNKEKLKKLQGIFIENVLGGTYAQLTPVQAGDLYMKNYINDYKEEMQEYIDGLKNKGEKLKLENSKNSHLGRMMGSLSLGVMIFAVALAVLMNIQTTRKRVSEQTAQYIKISTMQNEQIIDRLLVDAKESIKSIG